MIQLKQSHLKLKKSTKYYHKPSFTISKRYHIYHNEYQIQYSDVLYFRKLGYLLSLLYQFLYQNNMTNFFLYILDLSNLSIHILFFNYIFKSWLHLLLHNHLDFDLLVFYDYLMLLLHLFLKLDLRFLDS